MDTTTMDAGTAAFLGWAGFAVGVQLALGALAEIKARVDGGAHVAGSEAFRRYVLGGSLAALPAVFDLRVDAAGLACGAVAGAALLLLVHQRLRAVIGRLLGIGGGR